MNMTKKILGFDPGRDKCGLAIVDANCQVSYHQVIDSHSAIAIIEQLSQQFSVELIIMGDGTTSRDWCKRLESSLSTSVSIVTINEKNSTVEARDRYWQMYPPKGLNRIIPSGLRTPPRPVDDIVAILLVERYLINC
jgi:RNase H-fold protein (predicted Holliday junction resolvase)